jgi:hypothetical protein
VHAGGNRGSVLAHGKPSIVAGNLHCAFLHLTDWPILFFFLIG